jgi:multiple sugar transport system substrate-binding protein
MNTSAGVTYFPDTVTYADNTKEDCNLVILPTPVFRGGEKFAIQRGGGLSIFSSDSTKEYAAGIFLKWLTAPEQNLRFTSQTGYMPVTRSAFDEYIENEAENVTNINITKLRLTLLEMHDEFAFYFPPVFDGFEDVQRGFRNALRATAENSRREFLLLLDTLDAADAFEAVSYGVFEEFVSTH